MNWDLANASCSDIEQWLLAQFALISYPHTQANALHDPIWIDARSVRAVRPPTYGRTVIVECLGHLFEIKGVGLRLDAHPTQEPYGSGLLSLPTALGELFTQSLIEGYLRAETSNFDVVECLGVIQCKRLAHSVSGLKFHGMS
ncbi:hypothetical protein MesoLj113a_45070 [Mesorhizobium sp. 113-1-2]|nr:hypothetical protein MesoLj113a_45070 [Mesorhizobium sp. 113-1-2]